MRIRLFLSDMSSPELVRTVVEYESGETLEAVRGLDVGAHATAGGCFGWTQAVRAMTVMFLRWAAWRRGGQGGSGGPQPILEGGRSTLAASINDALSKKPNWLCDVFGSDSRGDPKTEFIRRSNRDFNTIKKSAVKITLDEQLLPPSSVTVTIGDAEVGDPGEMLALADKIERVFLEKARLRGVKKRGLGPSVQSEMIAVTQTERVVSTKGNPPQLPSLFVGRDKDLQAVKDMLRIGVFAEDDDRPRRTVIVRGWPGVGKSTLAAALANDEEVCRHFQDGILWLSLGENPNILSSLASLGRPLGYDELSRADSIRKAAELLGDHLCHRRCLLVVDDVWESAHVAPFSELVPVSGFLVTTRLTKIAHRISDTTGDIYVLPELTEQASIDLLGILAPEALRRFPDECAELVRVLEGLPLALRVAGQLLQMEVSHGWGVEELICELKEDATALLDEEVPLDLSDMLAQTTPTVAALLRRSCRGLPADIRDRFAYLGAFAARPATFDLTAMASQWQVDDPKPTARHLIERGLLEPVGGERFQMHGLVAAYAKALLVE